MGKYYRATVIFTLPPSVNACWRTFRGRVILSKQYREWRAENTHPPENQQPQNIPMPVPVAINIMVHPGKHWRNCDLDNRIKPLLDQLQHNHYIYGDDTKWVHSVCIHLGEPAGLDDNGEKFESYVSINLTGIGRKEKVK